MALDIIAGFIVIIPEYSISACYKYGGLRLNQFSKFLSNKWNRYRAKTYVNILNIIIWWMNHPKYQCGLGSRVTQWLALIALLISLISSFVLKVNNHYIDQYERFLIWIKYNKTRYMRNAVYYSLALHNKSLSNKFIRNPHVLIIVRFSVLITCDCLEWLTKFKIFSSSTLYLKSLSLQKWLLSDSESLILCRIVTLSVSKRNISTCGSFLNFKYKLYISILTCDTHWPNKTLNVPDRADALNIS